MVKIKIPVSSHPSDPGGASVARSFWRAWLERLAPSRFQLVLPRTAPGAPVQDRSAHVAHKSAPYRQNAGPRFQGVFTIRAVKVGQCELPGPLVFRTSPPDDWHVLYFYMVVIRGLGKTLILNPGLPDDLSEINSVWTAIAGERCRVRRTHDERTEAVLESLGVAPESVEYVLLTPFKTYAIGNLDLFPNATVCLSQRGWTEQYLARRYPLPEPDPLAIPDEVFDRLQRGVPNPIKLLRDEDEILPGVRAFRVGVRDRSSMAYVVNTGSGGVVLSDCCFKYENVEQPQPTGIADSLEECLTAYTRIRSEGSTIVPLSDPAVLERFPDGRIG
jgi:glyoxylase-like metal-dependent hydrolase (beta-lactamase superfamily II)